MASISIKYLIHLAILAIVLCEDEQTGENFVMCDDHLCQVHKDLDTNNDSKVSTQELLAFSEKHQKDVELGSYNVEEEIQRKDMNGDGKLSLEEYLDDEEIAESAPVQALLKAADKDGDGLLSKHELPAYISPSVHEHMVETLAKNSISYADSNHDGQLSLQEFTDHGYGNDLHGWVEEGHGEQIFHRLDTNKDGHLDAQELHPLESGKVNHEVMADMMMKILDLDGDRHVDAAEVLSGKDTIPDSELQEHLIAWAQKRRTVV